MKESFASYFARWSQSYYARAQKLGKSGDFYTAVSIGPLFGRLIALKLFELKPKTIVEIGANEGYLLSDIALFLKELGLAPKLVIIEPHERLRALQKEHFAKLDLELIQLEGPSALKLENAAIISNELFDSFPCDLVDNDKQLFVREHELFWDELEPEIKEYKNELGCHKGELRLSLLQYLKELKNCGSFSFLGFDYCDLDFLGDFSLKVFSKHQVLDPFKLDLSEYFAQSDITANLNLEELEFCCNKLGFLNFHKKRQNAALFDFLNIKINGTPGLELLMTDPKCAASLKHLSYGLSDNFYYFSFQNP